MTGEKLMQWFRVATICSLVVFCFGAGGEICGTFFETTAAAFGTKFPHNQVEDIEAVIARLKETPFQDNQPENSQGIPLAVMVTDEQPRSLLAINLRSGEQLWKISPPVQSEITVGDDLVIYSSTSQINVHDIYTGKLLWSYELETGWDYHGADVQSGTVAISVGVGGLERNQYANGRLIALEARSGVPIWDHVSGGGLLGEPLVHGGMVFVPWDRQKIVILDAASGKEMCRILANDFTINHAEANSHGVFYGSKSSRSTMSALFRLDTESATGKKAGTTAFAPRIELVPGEPSFHRDVFAKPVPGRSAAEKIRFHWKPALSKPDTIAMTDDHYYLHYWKYVFALDRNTNQVKWAHRSDKDIESIDIINGYVLGVDSEGHLFAIHSASGAVAWTVEAGTKVVTGVFDAAGFAPESKGQRAADPIVALKEIIWDKDNRMLPIRAYATFLLAEFPSPEVTRDLLQIYSNSSTPKGLRDAVVKALANRKVGGQYLVDALHMRYDFLEQTQPPPMNVVAPALVNMKEKSAVPGLLSHLMDHETSVDHLPYIAVAIRDLGDISTVGTLKQFLTLYHADSSFTEHEDALALAAESILAFDDKKDGKKFIVKIMNDPQTLPELKNQLHKLYNPEAAARAEREAQKEKEAKMKASAEMEARKRKEKEKRVPNSLTRSTINRTVAAYQQHFRPCVQAALGLSPSLRSIRMRFMITGKSGMASELRILPSKIPNLSECLSNALSMVQFPLFRNLRQVATYTITIENSPSVQVTKELPPVKDKADTESDPDAFDVPQNTPNQTGEAQDPDAF